MWTLTLLLLGQGAGFFERAELDFWGGRRKPAPAAAELWPESEAPVAVRRLLEQPSPEHAKAYLAWQEERFRRLRAAVQAVREASTPPQPAAPPGELLYFARPGCRWCDLQDRELEGLAVTRVPEGSPLWDTYGVKATPALARGSRVLRGFAPRAVIEEELLRAR